MNNQDVFGSKISVYFPTQSQSSSSDRTTSSPVKSTFLKQQTSASPNHGLANNESHRRPSPSYCDRSSDTFYGGPPPDLIRQDTNLRADSNGSYQKYNSSSCSSNSVKWNQFSRMDHNYFNDQVSLRHKNPSDDSAGQNVMQGSVRVSADYFYFV